MAEKADPDKIMMLCNALFEVSNDLCDELQKDEAFAELGRRLAILSSDLWSDVEIPLLRANAELAAKRKRERHGAK